MFSGIIRHIGSVAELTLRPDGARLISECPMFSDAADPVREGDSISHSGVCLTVVSLLDTGSGAGRAVFDIGSETLRRTTLGRLSAGHQLNLERSLRVGDRIDGHFVQGHVDAVGTVLDIAREGDTVRIDFSAPAECRGLLAPKGSVTVDGVSLTIGSVSPSGFSVFIIPATLAATTIGGYMRGTEVNLETDCIARYVAAALARSTGAA